VLKNKLYEKWFWSFQQGHYTLSTVNSPNLVIVVWNPSNL